MESGSKFISDLQQHPVNQSVRFSSHPVDVNAENILLFSLKQESRIIKKSTSYQMLILRHSQSEEANFSHTSPSAIIDVKFIFHFYFVFLLNQKKFVTRDRKERFDFAWLTQNKVVIRDFNMMWLKQEKLHSDESVLLGPAGHVSDVLISPLTTDGSLEATWTASPLSSMVNCTFAHPNFSKLLNKAKRDAQMFYIHPAMTDGFGLFWNVQCSHFGKFLFLRFFDFCYTHKTVCYTRLCEDKLFSWKEAAYLCKSLGGYLPQLFSSRDQQELTDMLKLLPVPTEAVFIGFTFHQSKKVR